MMRSSVTTAVFKTASLVLGLLCAAGAAAGDLPKFDGIRVGLGDCYKVGVWTPVTVTIRGGSLPVTGLVTLTVQDDSNLSCGVSSPADRPCLVLPGQRTSVTLYVRFGHPSSSLRANFIVDGRSAFEYTFRSGLEVSEGRYKDALDSRELIVCVGKASAGVEEAITQRSKNAMLRPMVVRLGSVEQLPTRWYGYEGVDALVLTTSQPEIYRPLTGQSAQLAALDEWIHNGGKLLLSVGAAGDEVLHAAGPLARFAPGKFDELVSLRQAAGLEVYANSHTPLSGTLRSTRLKDVEGIVDVREADLPLVVRAPRGFGQVTFLAADLETAPLATWNDRGELVAKLLDQPTAVEEQADAGGFGMHQGYNDLAGQLRGSLQFQGVYLIPFWLVALLVVVYILLIGPGDYLFLRKVVRGMHWTWLTFPTLVVVVCVGAYVLAYRLKGNQLRMAEVHLVDVDGPSGRVRGTAWMKVFSPRMESFSLSFAPRLPDGNKASQAQSLLAWLGLPGSGFGGMAPQPPGMPVGEADYWFSPSLAAMRGVPIQVWSTKSFTSRWGVPGGAGGVTGELAEEDHVLSGRITNPLPFALGHCFLAYDRYAYDLGSIGAGKSIDLGAGNSRVELNTLLKGRHFAIDDSNKSHEQTPTYDQASVDPRYILRAMMFYNAIGGHGYTRLLNQYQQFVDLSALLKMHRAILVAEPAAEDSRPLGGELLSGSSPLRGPGDHRTVMYRFVLPVSPKP
jgi:hypothetical protein